MRFELIHLTFANNTQPLLGYTVHTLFDRQACCSGVTAAAAAAAAAVLSQHEHVEDVAMVADEQRRDGGRHDGKGVGQVERQRARSYGTS